MSNTLTDFKFNTQKEANDFDRYEMKRDIELLQWKKENARSLGNYTEYVNEYEKFDAQLRDIQYKMDLLELCELL